MLNLFRRLFARTPKQTLRTFRVLARRCQVPSSSQPVFRELYIKGTNAYDAARKFDQTYTGWTRLSVTLRPEY